MSEFCFCLFILKLAHCSVFGTSARNVAVVHLVRTGTQFIQVFSILSISSSVSLTHGAAHTLTHTFASSDTHIESLHLMLFSGSSLAGYSGTIHRAGAERGRHLQAAAIHCNAMSVVKVSSWFFECLGPDSQETAVKGVLAEHRLRAW